MMNNRPTLFKVGIASLIMMSSVALSRVIGLLREMTIAFVSGAGSSVDAYQVAFILPEILNHIVASGFLSITFIPILSACLAGGKGDEAWNLFSTILNVLGGILVILVCLSCWKAPLLVALLAPGLDNPATVEKAVTMTRIILPAQIFFFSGGLFMAVQFVREKFIIPALAPLVYNLGIIIGGLALGPRLGMEGFAWGVLAGAFVGNFCLQAIGAALSGMTWRPVFNLRHPDFIRYILLTLPLMLGLTMTFSTEILLKFFGSFLSAGSIAALNYSLRIMFILVGLFGQAVGVASYPYLAGLAAGKKFNELNRLLNQTIKALFLVIPFSVLLMVLSHEIVLILFERGRFDAEATRMTAAVLPWLLAGTVAFTAQTVVVRGFYARQNTLIPALFSTIAVVLSLPVFLVFMKVMDTRGLALALSVSATFQAALLFWIWNRKSGNREAGGVYRFLLRISLISIVIGCALKPWADFLRTLMNPETPAGALGVCLGTGFLFLVLLAGAGTLFNIRELAQLWGKIKTRLPLKKE